jgi:hypothetical protein
MYCRVSCKYYLDFLKVLLIHKSYPAKNLNDKSRLINQPASKINTFRVDTPP